MIANQLARWSSSAFASERRRVEAGLKIAMAGSRGIVCVEAKQTMSSIAAAAASIDVGQVVVPVSSTRLDAIKRGEASMPFEANCVISMDSDSPGLLARDYLFRYITTNMILFHREVFSSEIFVRRVDVGLSTSGSTGESMTIFHTREHLMRIAEDVKNEFELTSRDCLLLAIPWWHVFGLCSLASHLMAGSPIYLTASPLYGQLRSSLQKDLLKGDQVWVAAVPFSVPLIEKALRGLKKTKPVNVCVSGGKCDGQMLSRLKGTLAANGGRLFYMYGATEVGGRISLGEYNCHSHQSLEPDVGIPLPLWSIKKPNPGETGSLILESDSLAWLQAKNRDELIKRRPSRHVELTDIVERKLDGRLRVLGRSSRMIKPFGRRIQLDDLETVFARKGITVACVPGSQGADDAWAIVFNGRIERACQIWKNLAQSLKISETCLRVVEAVHTEPPLLENGKLDYVTLASQFIHR